MKWSIEEIKSILPNSEKIARSYGLSVALAGSVAHNFQSSNDLDFAIFDLKTSNKGNHSGFLLDFINRFNLKLDGAVDHSEMGDEKLVYKLKTQDNKKN